MTRKFYFIVFLLVTLTSCETNKETILFSSSINGNSDIFIMDNDGKQIQKNGDQLGLIKMKLVF